MPNKKNAMTSSLEIILELASTGFRIFPCREKRPITKNGFKDASAAPEQITAWWTQYPDAQVGLPTGHNINAFVLDVDLPDGPASLAMLEAKHGPLPPTWQTRTASGGEHHFYAMPANREIRNSASKIAPGLDVRGEGGYVIAPPSPGYIWISGGVGLAQAPEWLLDLIAPFQPAQGRLPRPSADTTPYGRKALEAEAARVALAPIGTRNQTLNSAAYSIGQLVAGGQVDRSEAEGTLLHAADRAGLNPAEAAKTFASGFASGEQRPRKPGAISSINNSAKTSTPSTASSTSAPVISSSTTASGSSTASTNEVSHLVDEFIEQATGIFTSSELYQWAGLTTRAQRVAASQALLRRIHKFKIERVGTRHGHFRKVESECAAIDFLATEEPAVDITLPFGLDKMVELMPGNICVVAGEPNAGKTAFLLNIVRMNMHKAQVHYFNSEMGAQEMRKRLSKFGLPLNAWTFHPWERTDNFQDAIRQGYGVINIIDFLEISEDFYRVGGQLKAIHDKLHGALAIIALQKNKGTDLGLGGGRSLEKPRLYLALEPGLIKIVKAKNWRTKDNPNGMQLKFKIVDGCRFLPQGEWNKSTE